VYNKGWRIDLQPLLVCRNLIIKNMKKIFSSIILLSLIIPVLSFAKDETQEKCFGSTDGRSKCGQGLLTLENRLERPLLRASSTEKRLENRENNIERIRERIASTTLATTSTSSVRRMENLDRRLEK